MAVSLRAPRKPSLAVPIARGITSVDVDRAADALLRAGERSTIEKVRVKIGRGSLNTVTRCSTLVEPLPGARRWTRRAGPTPGTGALRGRGPLAGRAPSRDASRRRGAGPRKRSLAKERQEIGSHPRARAPRERTRDPTGRNRTPHRRARGGSPGADDAAPQGAGLAPRPSGAGESRPWQHHARRPRARAGPQANGRAGGAPRRAKFTQTDAKVDSQVAGEEVRQSAGRGDDADSDAPDGRRRTPWNKSFRL